MWVHGDRRAATCHADTLGVLPYGLRVAQAVPAKHQSTESSEPNVHLPGVVFTGEHGAEAEAYQDKNCSSGLKDLSLGILVFSGITFDAI